jgi:hypothetical protein
MKTINYHGKEIKLIDGIEYGLDGDPLTEIEISNRFSGEKATVPAFAVAVYDTIMGAEVFGDWDLHRKGLDWFRKNFPSQYMTLLD